MTENGTHEADDGVSFPGETRPRCLAIVDDWRFNPCGVNPGQATDPRDMVSIHPHASHCRILAVRRQRQETISDLRERPGGEASSNMRSEIPDRPLRKPAGA